MLRVQYNTELIQKRYHSLKNMIGGARAALFFCTNLSLEKPHWHLVQIFRFR